MAVLLRETRSFACLPLWFAIGRLGWNVWLFLPHSSHGVATLCLQRSTIFYDYTISVTWIGFAWLRSRVVCENEPPIWKTAVENWISECGHKRTVSIAQSFRHFLICLVFAFKWINCDNLLISIYIWMICLWQMSLLAFINNPLSRGCVSFSTVPNLRCQYLN